MHWPDYIIQETRKFLTTLQRPSKTSFRALNSATTRTPLPLELRYQRLTHFEVDTDPLFLLLHYPVLLDLLVDGWTPPWIKESALSISSFLTLERRTHYRGWWRSWEDDFVWKNVVCRLISDLEFIHPTLCVHFDLLRLRPSRVKST